MTGVFAPQWTDTMAQVLGNLGLERAWVVHAHDGSDELTTTGPSKVSELNGGKVTTYKVSPEDAGLERSTLDQIKGGDPEYNAVALHALLDGTPSAFRDCVVLTAAGSLIIAGKTDSLKSGVAIAQEAIDSGAARQTLVRLVEITNRGR
jgi:anthranilate phosphoribosyltransferase